MPVQVKILKVHLFPPALADWAWGGLLVQGQTACGPVHWPGRSSAYMGLRVTLIILVSDCLGNVSQNT